MALEAGWNTMPTALRTPGVTKGTGVEERDGGRQASREMKQ